MHGVLCQGETVCGQNASVTEALFNSVECTDDYSAWDNTVWLTHQCGEPGIHCRNALIHHWSTAGCNAFHMDRA